MIFIAGGTGFIGKHLLRALKERGRRARCLVRTPERAALCEREGFEAVVGDITDRESLRGKLEGVSLVVHLVGIIADRGGMTFEKVHVEGTRNLVDEAKAAAVSHFFYQSALGASLTSRSRYQKSKAEAEEIVKGSGLPFTIFRPSLVIGEKDGFTAKLEELVALAPVVTIPGEGKSRFQPVYVGDWVKCFLAIIGNESALGKTYELGGPEHLTYNEIVGQFMEAQGVRKPVVHVPMGFMKMSIPFMSLAQGLGRLIGKELPAVTLEQLSLLEVDNICETDSIEKNFGFKPISYREALRRFITPAR